MKIKWQSLAEKDLLEIVTYIAEDNPQAAHCVLDEIEEQTTLLADHPDAGRLGRVAGTRELVVLRTPYIIPYRIQSDTVNVLRVLHGARKWPQVFNPHKEEEDRDVNFDKIIDIISVESIQ